MLRAHEADSSAEIIEAAHESRSWENLAVLAPKVRQPVKGSKPDRPISRSNHRRQDTRALVASIGQERSTGVNEDWVRASSLGLIDVVGRDLPADQCDAGVATAPAGSAADLVTQRARMPVRAHTLIWIEQRQRSEIGRRHRQMSGATSAAKRSAPSMKPAVVGASKNRARCSTPRSANLRASAATSSGEPRIA